MSTEDPHRALVALLPQFLQRRRVGWSGQPMEQSGLERPAFFLLMAIVRELDPGTSTTYAELLANLFNPYSTIRPVLESAARAGRAGLSGRSWRPLQRDGGGTCRDRGG